MTTTPKIILQKNKYSPVSPYIPSLQNTSKCVENGAFCTKSYIEIICRLVKTRQMLHIWAVINQGDPLWVDMAT